jgi:hypothetical protein
VQKAFAMPFPLKALEEVAATGAIAEITWEPWKYQLGVKQDSYPLTAIANGTDDSYVEQWVKGAEIGRG